MPTYTAGRARIFRDTIIDISPRLLYKLLHLGEDTYPFLYPAEHYERDDIATALFSFPVLEQPTLGWVRHWLGNDLVDPIIWEYINFPLGNTKDWDWGYVFWDTERLIRWKAPILEVEDSER
jgi:hypothetical protein